MIRHSFIFLEGIGKQQEENLWEQGIKTWDDFLNAGKIKGISPWRKAYYDRKLKEAKQNLYNLNPHYFYEKVPLNEQWRLYEFFKDEAIYLDIETSGIAEYSYITVLGLFDGADTKVMIKDINLDFNYLKNYLKNYKMVVTFNGSVFDLPFILKRHTGLIPKIPHFDLRHACGKMGLSGGLKNIEKTLNIKRRNEIISNLNGGDMVTLWRMYKATGNERYINLLVEYNEEDIINLKTIANHIYNELKSKLIK